VVGDDGGREQVEVGGEQRKDPRADRTISSACSCITCPKKVCVVSSYVFNENMRPPWARRTVLSAEPD
jgi:hypothetical protein